MQKKFNDLFVAARLHYWSLKFDISRFFPLHSPLQERSILGKTLILAADYLYYLKFLFHYRIAGEKFQITYYITGHSELRTA